MSTAMSIAGVRQPSLLKPILVGGAIAGILDEICAIVTMGWQVPRADAAGILGPAAFKSTGIGIWILGVLIHFFIAFAAAAIYCYASRLLPFLKQHFIVCGMFYGIAVFLVMYLIVMPMCAFHYAGPYTQRGLLQGIIAHILLVGLPIGWSLHRWVEA